MLILVANVNLYNVAKLNIPNICIRPKIITLNSGFFYYKSKFAICNYLANLLDGIS